MASRTYHHGNLRQALLDAALAVISAEGAAALTMARLARTAGVSSGAPYRHFKSIDAVLIALVTDGWNRLMVEEIPDATQSPLEQFRRAGIATVRFAAAHPTLYALMCGPIARRLDDPVLTARIQAGDARTQALVDATIASGELQSADTEAQILAAQALIYGLSRMVVDGALTGLSPDAAEALAWRVTEVLGVGLLDPSAR